MTHVKVSPDGKFILSTGEDGCVFVISIVELDFENKPI